MKGKLLVVFHSNHGYVKRYVDIIGNALGCDAVPADKLKADMLSGYDKFLYIGSIKNDEINGLKKFAEFYEAVYKKLVICGVGLSPFRNYIPQRIKEASVSVTYEKFVPVFYAQGGFDVDELSRLEKLSIKMRVNQIRAANYTDDSDTFLMNAINHPIDEVCQANIQPLIDYLDGKAVDEKLYSPPEITDPKEEKKFFEELESAMKAPENKKRALKKKLKKNLSKKSKPSDSSKVPTESTEKEVQSEVTESADKVEPSDADGEAEATETAAQSETTDAEVPTEPAEAQ